MQFSVRRTHTVVRCHTWPTAAHKLVPFRQSDATLSFFDIRRTRRLRLNEILSSPSLSPQRSMAAVSIAASIEVEECVPGLTVT